ncbi:MAG: hypothetical protein OEQ53_01030 [Saprospiraceae bacterium]|nr:hypothetical protein [Saprospiraceae bacterium]
MNLAYHMALYILVLLGSVVHGIGQNKIVWTEPADPAQTDEITVFFYASQGNGALAGFTNNIYAHTGVITDRSMNATDWQQVVGNWGTADNRTLMTKEADENI